MTTSPAAPDEPASVWADFLEIFYAPAEVFARRRDDPKFGLALLVLVAAVLVTYFATRGAMEPIFDAEIHRGMAAAVRANPQLTTEQTERFMETARKFLPVNLTLFVLFVPFLLGVLLWLAGKVVEARQTLTQAVMVATYAYFPRLLEAIVNALQALVLPDERLVSRYSVTLGPGRFLDPDSQQLLLSIVGRLDLFTLWVTALLAIGLSVTGRIPRGRAAIAAALVWVVGGLFGVWGAVRAG